MYHALESAKIVTSRNITLFSVTCYKIFLPCIVGGECIPEGLENVKKSESAKNLNYAHTD